MTLTMSDILQLLGTGLAFIVLYLIMLFSVIIIPFGVPGEFLIVIAALVWSLVTGGHAISLWVVAILLGIGIIAELIEASAGFLGASHAEGSIWSAFGAIAGGILGAIIGSFILPIIGSILGALLGTFAGAYLVEYYRTRTFATASSVARGALIGRILGSIAKIFCAVVMIIIVTFYLI